MDQIKEKLSLHHQDLNHRPLDFWLSATLGRCQSLIGYILWHVACKQTSYEAVQLCQVVNKAFALNLMAPHHPLPSIPVQVLISLFIFKVSECRLQCTPGFLKLFLCGCLYVAYISIHYEADYVHNYFITLLCHTHFFNHVH